MGRRTHSDEFLERAKRFWLDPNKRTTNARAELGISKDALIGLAHRQKWGLKRTVAQSKFVQLPPTGCAWPEGDPAKADFSFCNAPTHIGRSYCTEHCNRAYVNFDPNRMPGDIVPIPVKKKGA